MKQKNVNLVEKHLEKAILALAAVFFTYVIFSYCLSDPYTVTLTSKADVKPNQVEKIVLDQVQNLEDRVRQGAKTPLPPISVPQYTQAFKDRIAHWPLQQVVFNPIGLGGLGEEVFPHGQDDTNAPGYVPVPLAPQLADAKSSRGVLVGVQELANYYDQQAALTTHPDPANFGQVVADAYVKLVDAQEPRDFNYVTISGVFDIGQWQQTLIQAGVQNEWVASTLALVQVTLHRQTYQPDTGDWSATQDITPLPGSLTPFRYLPPKWPDPVRAEQAIKVIKAQQQRIAQPSFVPMTDAVARVMPFEQIGSPPDASDSLFDDEDQDESAKPRPVQVWAYDLTVEPNKTYRYRIAVSVINPLFQRTQIDPELQKKYFHRLAINSDYSQWSQPVSIQPKHYFFVVSGGGASQSVNVEIWRVFDGQWVMEDFQVKAGDSIGGKIDRVWGDQTVPIDMAIGSVAVDVIGSGAAQDVHKSIQLVYLDLESNTLHSRFVSDDRNSPVRRRLTEGQMTSTFVTGNQADARTASW